MDKFWLVAFSNSKFLQHFTIFIKFIFQEFKVARFVFVCFYKYDSYAYLILGEKATKKHQVLLFIFKRHQ